MAPRAPRDHATVRCVNPRYSVQDGGGGAPRLLHNPVLRARVVAHAHHTSYTISSTPSPLRTGPVCEWEARRRIQLPARWIHPPHSTPAWATMYAGRALAATRGVARKVLSEPVRARSGMTPRPRCPFVFTLYTVARRDTVLATRVSRGTADNAYRSNSVRSPVACAAAPSMPCGVGAPSFRTIPFVRAYAAGPR
ncbi:hypothetical protein B0H16DRAFT_1748692 [Mycena metata]|uniref:Uncharacterized protein n=1 Tax=Mycena metata TaxID=1033252 RepID=A0AAD7DZ43_9AGAR|nr:hypothetical protein B0H16DRAFT_1748692 [Mycena metata]